MSWCNESPGRWELRSEALPHRGKTGQCPQSLGGDVAPGERASVSCEGRIGYAATFHERASSKNVRKNSPDRSNSAALGAIRRRLDYPHVISTLSLIVALGGTSYAAISVSGRDIRAHSITERNIRADTLTGRSIEGLTSRDIRNGSLRASDFRAGDLPAGAQGAVGPTGPPGVGGSGEFVVRRGPDTVDVPPSATDQTVTEAGNADCGAGETAVGGGVDGYFPQHPDAVVVASYPSPRPAGEIQTTVARGWRALIRYSVKAGDSIVGPQVWVICAKPSG